MGERVCKHGEVIPATVRYTIARRYRAVTKAINREFWNTQSNVQHSFYVGSYGRGTAIDTSDIDILVELPEHEYDRCDMLKGNGQSRLLQTVKNAILATYPCSDIRADGQVVKINFSDEIQFEILPAFIDWTGIYIYPDTNMGGNWRSTDPKAEQYAMKKKNESSNGLLYDTCKHMRRIRDEHFKSYHLSGIVIDSFVYAAMGNWRWLSNGESSTSERGDYERTLLEYLDQYRFIPLRLSAPGSKQIINIDDSIACLRKVLQYMAE